MRIVIVSLYFPPRIGGVENVMYGLANEWHRKGHEVTVFTFTHGRETYGFPVIRSVSLVKLIREVKRSDVFFEANISMRTFLVGLLFRRKWFVLHHLTYTHIQRWQEVLKNQLTRFSKNIAPSQFVADTLKGKCLVIPNFFSGEFSRDESVIKDKDIVFVGRLVSDKGAEDLLKSIVIIKEKGIRLSCTIIGDGPEKDKLISFIHENNLEGLITLTGFMSGKALISEINAHRVMVIPSKWPEPYGVVVLEGLACGCRIVCSSDGGLPEAANGFGFLYPNNDVNALADRIQRSLAPGPYEKDEVNRINSYLATRTAAFISHQYLQLFLNDQALYGRG